MKEKKLVKNYEQLNCIAVETKTMQQCAIIDFYQGTRCKSIASVFFEKYDKYLAMFNCYSQAGFQIGVKVSGNFD